MRKLVFVLLAGALAMGACSKKETPPEEPTKQEPAVKEEPVKEEPVKEEPPPEEPAADTANEGKPELPDVEFDLAALDPGKATETAPEIFRVKFETTEGEFEVEVNRKWAPNGADRFYNLVKLGYYRNIAAFRVIDGFMAQFGIHGTPEVNTKWREARIQDDPRNPEVSNKRGYLTYAMAGPNTRTSQLFINFRDNGMLDNQGFTPFGVVVGDGMNVVDKWHKGYGEGAPRGRGPDQGAVQARGNEYLRSDFPNLDYILNITLVEGDSPSAATTDAPDEPVTAKKWEDGSYEGPVTGGGLSDAVLRLNVTAGGKVMGSFKGSRESKGFIIPVNGTMQDDGSFNISGKKGPNVARLNGRFNNGQLAGEIKGNINSMGLSVNFTAKK